MLPFRPYGRSGIGCIVNQNNGINDVGFNVEEQEGIHTSSSMQGAAMEAKYRDFLRTFWRLSEEDSYHLYRNLSR